MLQSQTIQLRMSELRDGLNALAGRDDDLSDDEIADSDAKRSELRSAEAKYRAALTAEAEQAADAAGQFGDSDGSGSELRTMLSNASIERIIAAAVGGQRVDGAEAELQSHFGLDANQIPMALLQSELRSVTTTNLGDAVSQQAIVPAVFPTEVSQAMGVRRVNVPVGMAMFPTVDEPNTAAGETAAGSSVADDAIVLSGAALSPARVTNSILYQREQAAVIPGLAEAIRTNLATGVANGLDNQALNKASAGLLDFGTDPTADGTTETYATYVALGMNQVDGKYANSPANVRMLVGPQTLRHMASVYRTTSSERSALDQLNATTGGVLTSAAVAAASGGVQQGVSVRGLGLEHAHQAIWPGATIENIYDGDTAGTIRVTVVALAAVEVSRTAGYNRFAVDIS